MYVKINALESLNLIILSKKSLGHILYLNDRLHLNPFLHLIMCIHTAYNFVSYHKPYLLATFISNLSRHIGENLL